MLPEMTLRAASIVPPMVRLVVPAFQDAAIVGEGESAGGVGADEVAGHQMPLPPAIPTPLATLPERRLRAPATAPPTVTPVDSKR